MCQKNKKISANVKSIFDIFI